jgi:hypothetical protein
MSKKSGDNKNGVPAKSSTKPTKPKAPRAERVPSAPKPGAPTFEDLGDLPSGYGAMFLIARDPHWLFCYWDFDYTFFPANRQLLLQVYRGDLLETVIEINEIARNWYIPVLSADADYRVVFGHRSGEGKWTEVGSAGPTRTPPESISGNWETQFATVPFHLSFNFLLDVIAAAKAENVPLAQALGQLQASATGGTSSFGIDQMQLLETLLGKELLERLFSMNSGQVIDYLRGELGSSLNSESASELIAKGRLASLLAPSQSSLFSGAIGRILAQELASGGVSSFGRTGVSTTQLGGSSSEIRSSQIGGESSSLGGESSSLGGASSSSEIGGQSSGIGGFSSEIGGSSSELGGLSSELGGASSEFGGLSARLGGFSSELGGLSSELGGLSSEFGGLSSETFSSGFGFVESSGFGPLYSASLAGASETISSWFSGLTSSSWFNSETISSWLTGESFASWESTLSSYGLSSFSSSFEQLGQLAGLSSWSGLEFGMSSWSELVSESSLFSGVGASWSAQPFGEFERGFFMHVNAEVIFYGGTDPRAKVTIDGQPIQLQPDGTFRYHFKFPDNNFEIPIIAVSPDGVETRSATLYFKRETTREGDVGATVQPPYLGVPMGAR